MFTPFRVVMGLAVAVAAAAGLMVATSSPAHSVNSTIPPKIAPCFNNHGVEFGSLQAFLCEHKLGGDPSGGLYFALSVDDGLNKINPNGQMNWIKLHAAKSNYYAWENYAEPWGGQPGDVRSSMRIIALDEGEHLGQCIIVWPDWTVMPTMCFRVRDGGAIVEAPHVMDQRELNSAAEYAKNVQTDNTIPLHYR